MTRVPLRSLAPFLAAVTTVLAVAVPVSASAVEPRLQVAGASPLPAHVTVLHRAVTTSFDVVLRQRNATFEQTYLRGLSTTSSPYYRHFLTPAQFARDFGASVATVRTVRDYLVGQGFTLKGLSTGRLVLSLTGSTARIARVFQAHVTTVRRADGTVDSQFTSAATLPASIARDVVGIEGLANVAGQSSDLVHARTTSAAPSTCGSAGTSSNTPNSVGGYTVQKQGQLYGLASAWAAGDTGAGQTIALYELGQYDNNDTAVFFTCYGLSPSITSVNIDGGATGGFSDEATMDVEEAAALAPGASVIVYQGPNANAGPVDTYTAIADADVATIVSTSWGDCESDPSGAVSAEAPIFEQMVAEGITVVTAAGDNGSSDCNGITNNSPAVDDPSSQPYVTSVGGLSVTSISPLTQSVWNGSGGAAGGGRSAVWGRPWWQSGKVFAGDTSQGVAGSTMRMVPDLSTMADPTTGFIQYFTGTSTGTVVCGHSSCSGWASIGGTSIGAPLVSALVAVAAQYCTVPRLGFLNPTLYADASNGVGFNDVTSGSNDLYQQGAYSAGKGYDLASGLGSPDTTLVHSLCPASASASTSVLSGPSGALINHATTYTLVVKSSSGLPLANTSVALSASGTTGVLSFDAATSSQTGAGAASYTTISSATGVVTFTLSDTKPGAVTLSERSGTTVLHTSVVTFSPLPLSLLVPVAPKIVKVAPGTTTVTIRLASHSATTPPVTAYQVTVNGGKSWLTFPAGTVLTLRHLNAHTSYALVIRGVNANGVGARTTPARVATLA